MAYPTAVIAGHRRARREGLGPGLRPAPDGGVVARERRRQVGERCHRAGPRCRLRGHQQERHPALVHHGDGRRLRARRVFEFAVTSGPLAVATWRYEFEETEAGCRVTESWVDQRKRGSPRWPASWATTAPRTPRRRWRRRWPTWPRPSSTPAVSTTRVRSVLAAAAPRARPRPRRRGRRVRADARPRPGGAARRRCRRT